MLNCGRHVGHVVVVAIEDLANNEARRSSMAIWRTRIP
jgi:hypothetical protein